MRYISIIIMALAIISCKSQGEVTGQGIKDFMPDMSYSTEEMELAKEFAKDTVAVTYFLRNVIDTLDGKFYMKLTREEVVNAGYSGEMYDLYAKDMAKLNAFADSLKKYNMPSGL